MTTENVMYAVLPIAYTPAKLTSSTAVNADPYWDSGTSYAKDYKVTHDAPDGSAVLHHVYMSLVSSNTTEPGTDPLKWVDLGPANREAMFDTRISTRTTGTSPLVITLAPGSYASNLGLLNITGTSVTVEVLQGLTVVYTKTVSLQGAEIASWWDYYFTPDEQVTLALFDSLPMLYSPTIRITLTGVGTVGIGHCVFGTRQDLGVLQPGASADVIDYSRKETDEFGVTTFVERDYADEFSGQLLVKNVQLNSLKRTLRKLRATPTLYVGTPDERFTELFVAFGWVRSHRLAVPYPFDSLLDIEIGALA